MKFELVLLSAAFFSAATGKDDWGYGTTDGPSTWAARYPQCGGKRQSPIALNINTTYRPRESSFEWCPTYSNVPNSMTLTNTGHDVSLKGVWDTTPCIRLDDVTYNFNSINFHWSSEHTIGGVRDALEMHMAFTPEGNSSQNIVIFARLFTESISSEETPGLAKVVDNLQYVRDANTSTHIKPFPISDMVPVVQLPMFMYNGSLTIPPCSEIVIWVVDGVPTGVTSSQLSTFRTLRDKKGNTLQNNYRPLQPINGRTVSFPNI